MEGGFRDWGIRDRGRKLCLCTAMRYDPKNAAENMKQKAESWLTQA